LRAKKVRNEMFEVGRIKKISRAQFTEGSIRISVGNACVGEMKRGKKSRRKQEDKSQEEDQSMRIVFNQSH
jgi:hypothetical protein